MTDGPAAAEVAEAAARARAQVPPLPTPALEAVAETARRPRGHGGGPGPRLRRPVLAADRAPDPRVRRLQRAAPARHPDRDDPRARSPKALVLSGGPASVYAEGAPALRTELLELGIPVLGHLLRHAADGPRARRQGRAGAGGRVRPHRADARATAAARCSTGLPAEQQCWMSHRDTVFEPPPGFDALASSPESPVAAFEDTERGPLRDPVPPRGRPHAARHRDPDPLPARHRRLPASSGRPPR